MNKTNDQLKQLDEKAEKIKKRFLDAVMADALIYFNDWQNLILERSKLK